MAQKRVILELGTGNDLHGGDYTKAALRAVQDALHHSSLAMLRALKVNPKTSTSVNVTKIALTAMTAAIHPASPRRARSAGLSISRSSAAASAVASAGGTTSALTPSRQNTSVPGIAVTTEGRPRAMASSDSRTRPSGRVTERVTTTLSRTPSTSASPVATTRVSWARACAASSSARAAFWRLSKDAAIAVPGSETRVYASPASPSLFLPIARARDARLPSAIQAVMAGKDVYVEKPVGHNVAEGRAMIRAARKYDKVMAVGTQQRSGPHYRRARDLVRDGHIGKVHSVRMWAFRNVMPGFGRPPDGDPPKELDYDAWLGSTP